MTLDSALGGMRSAVRWFLYALHWDAQEGKYEKHKKPENWSLSPNKLVAAAVYCSAQRRLN